ncbi:hypothetical protein [Staphylococcus lugdunensis]|uniref:hypothetical protein n=1 Tax=Staphylococcus lugdunensis TaxID=28035 RepID=UPI0013145D1D|nr:hypothetical protein [Staphylococcus lugdunensis]
MGPQQRDFRKESQRTTQVGVGPQQRDFRKESQQTTRVGVAPTERISTRNSTSTASWVAKTVLLASEPTIRSIVNKEGSGTTNS